jgi:excisionase family DNA binding protein
MDAHLYEWRNNLYSMSMPVDDDELKFYTTEEVAEILRTTPRNITAWIREGKLHAVKVGKFYRVSEKDLKEFLRK